MRNAVACLSFQFVAKHPGSRLIWALIFLSWAPLSGQIHPADVDSDGLLAIHEVTAYAQAGAAGAAWASGPSPVTEADAERAVFIWRNGERYALLGGVPVAAGWVPAPLDGTLFVTVENLRPEPLDRLELFGLPAGQEGLVLEYRVEGGNAIRYAPLDQEDTDRWVMTVPYVEGVPGGARPLELWVVSETERFPVVPLKPVALPPAPGIAVAISTRFAAIATITGEFLGADPSLYWNAAPEEIPQELRALVLVDRMVRDPENPNSLARVLDGTAPLLAEYGLQVEEIEPLLAKLGLLEQLDILQAVVATQGLAPAAFRSAAGADAGGGVAEPANFVDIGTLGQLAQAMRKQCAADRYANPSKEVQAVKDKAGLAALAVGLAGPVGAVAAASFSVATWSIDTYHLVIANQWPSEVDNVQLIFSPNHSVEDDCAPSSWETTMNASSKEWSLDKTIVTGALNLLGAYKAGSDALAEGANYGLRAGLKSSLDDAEGTTAGLLSDLSGMALDKTFPNTSVITVPASLWSGIRIANADFGLIEVEYQGDAVKQGATKRDVVPQNTGIATVRVRTLAGALGPCAVVEGAAVNYEVRENKVAITPSGGQVKPNQEIDFTAIVTDAKDLELEFTISHGTKIQETLNPDTGVHTLKWKAPPKDQMPEGVITITGRSTATDCLREGVIRQTVASLTPFKQELILIPSIDCMNPGDVQVFEVIDLRSGEIQAVAWEVLGNGSIVANGTSATYTAGEPGFDTILATVATDDGPVVLEQAVTVGCGLVASLFFDSADGPSLNRTVRTHSAGFIIDGIGLVAGDVYVDYTSLTPLADASPLAMARGTFAGAGLFYPADPGEELARFDDSEALRWYTVTTAEGIPVQYAVEAFFMLDLFDQEEREVLLADGRDGPDMQILLNAAGSGAGSLTDFENEIVAYNWTFSDGDSGNGDVITKTLSRNLSSLTITLEVVDRRGNWARYIETLTIVRVSGSFAFPYEPSGILTAAIPWDDPSDPLPPQFFGDSYLVFVTDPADSFIEVNLTGGRNTSAAANSSTVGIPQDEEVSIYNIGYISTDGLGFE